MRISTAMLYSNGTQGFQDRASELMKIQSQMASGKRVTTPSDDPISASAALVAQQAKSINEQFTTNRANARDALNVVDTTLGSVTDLLSYVKERAIQAGNGSLNKGDLQSIAIDLRARFDQMMGYANKSDPEGGYVFGGYRTNDQPFVGTVSSGVAFFGDQGSRAIQVSETRVIPTSNSGNEIFVNIPGINASFSTSAGAANTGSGTIDAGSVTGNYAGGAYQIRFTSATDYEVVNSGSGTQVSTGTFSSGTPISFGGVQVTVSGAPQAGDSFDIASGSSADIFTTLKGLIDTLENDSGAALTSKVNQAMSRIDKTLDNVLSVRASVGSRINETQALEAMGSQADVQYRGTISRLMDLDYAQASSDLAQRQVALQASQQAFVQTTGLSVFKYL